MFTLEPVDKIPDKLDKELSTVKPKAQPIIIVDSKEASGAKGKKGGRKIYENLLRMEEKGIIKVKVEKLGDAIDYAIPTRNNTWHLIQRKRATEMTNPKKVFEDLAEMSLVKDAEIYLLLEGNLSIIQKFTKMNPQSIIGSVETIILPQEYGGFNVKIIPSPNQYYTSLWLMRRALRVGTEKEKDIFKVVRESMSRDLKPHEQGLYFLTGLVGVSKTIGIRLMKTYGSAWNALMNIDKWVEDIRGLGERKMEKILKQLYAEWVDE